MVPRQPNDRPPGTREVWLVLMVIFNIAAIFCVAGVLVSHGTLPWLLLAMGAACWRLEALMRERAIDWEVYLRKGGER